MVAALSASTEMLNTRAHIVVVPALAAVAAFGFGQKAPYQSRDLSKGNTMYVVPYAHLDTQWRWAYPQVISEFIPNTLHKNFALIDKYPHYIFNFSGSRRYEFMKEYYPDDYERLKGYIKAGRWFPCGSSVDEGDANVPSAESLIRHELYGNRFFKKEFGVYSQEFMLPDCFGFPYALPTILAHCGTKGFSTQKLTWGSAVGIPFKVGTWEGPDGKSVVAALDPGSYSGDVDEDLSQNTSWLARIQNTGKQSGAFVDYHYYGTGDIGGGPHDDSVAWVEKSIVDGKGPISVVSAHSDDMFRSLTPAQIAKLPHYKGELLLTQHSAGSVSSQAYMKRWNRKNELLADGAERASVAAMWLGGAPYPAERLYNAWDLVLGSQMHDMLPGTSIPKAYEFCWNDEVLALNQFAAVETDAIGAVSSAMNTSGQGQALVVYNPLSIQREDVVDAVVAAHLDKGQTISVYGPDGKAIPTQVLGDTPGGTHILFLAKVVSCGFAVYDARTVAWTPGASELSVTDNNVIQNAHFRVTINEDGDIASVFDKANNREVLMAPAQLQFQYHNPSQFPAWNMDWEDAKLPPDAVVHGPAKISVIENGPLRATIRVERETNGSKFVQDIRLSAGDAGDRVEIDNHIDWQTREHALKASFPLTSGNPLATYDLQVGAIQRGKNDEKKYEVPQHQWFDLSQPDGKYGVGILNDSKFGSDKPDDDTVRLTLIYTPGVRGGYSDQATQDFGRHDITYAIAPHEGDWRATPWMAKRLNQPLRAFNVPAHEGALGKTLSLVSSNSNQVEITAVKKAEDGNEIIVRLRELEGKPAENVHISAAGGIVSAREVDGQERPIGSAAIKGKELVTSVPAFSLRAFALKLGNAPAKVKASTSQPIALSFDSDVASFAKNPKDGAFGSDGETYPAEQLPSGLTVDGIKFKLGSTADGAKNAITSNGQTIPVPRDCHTVFALAASTTGNPVGQVAANARNEYDYRSAVRPWSGSYIGQWDNRLWNADLGKDFSNYREWQGLIPGVTQPYEVAWYSNHRHDPETGNEFYEYCFLYLVRLEVEGDLVLAKNPGVKILALTAVKDLHDDATPAYALYDTLLDHGGTGQPVINTEGSANDYTTVTITPPMYWRKGCLHYTLDGTDPTAQSPVYEKPFAIYEPVTLKAAEIDPNVMPGPIVLYNLNVHDTSAPRIVLGTCVNSLGLARVQFSEPVDKASAENLGNYKFSSGASALGAKLLLDGRSVEITLDRALTVGQPESVSVSGVKDMAPTPNVTSNSSANLAERGAVFTSPVLQKATSAEYKPEGLPIKATDPWTLNLFCKVDDQPEDLTLIAGFGRAVDGRNGTGRYFSKFTKGINFWICNQDVSTEVPLDLGKWQMLTATYDGTTIRLYKNGEKIAEEVDNLSNDRAVVEVMPLDAWDRKRIFNGDVRDMTIWNEALTDAIVKRLWGQGNKS